MITGLAAAITVSASIFGLTGCDENALAPALTAVLPMGEKAAAEKLESLVEEKKITEAQKEQIIKLYNAAKKKVSSSSEAAAAADPVNAADPGTLVDSGITAD